MVTRGQVGAPGENSGGAPFGPQVGRVVPGCIPGCGPSSPRVLHRVSVAWISPDRHLFRPCGQLVAPGSPGEPAPARPSRQVVPALSTVLARNASGPRAGPRESPSRAPSRPLRTPRGRPRRDTSGTLPRRPPPTSDATSDAAPGDPAAPRVPPPRRPAHPGATRPHPGASGVRARPAPGADPAPLRRPASRAPPRCRTRGGLPTTPSPPVVRAVPTETPRARPHAAVGPSVGRVRGCGGRVA